VLAWPWDSIVVLTLFTGIWLVVMGSSRSSGIRERNDSKSLREVEMSSATTFTKPRRQADLVTPECH